MFCLQLAEELHSLDGGPPLQLLSGGGTNSSAVGGLSGPFSQHHHTGGVSAGMVGTASNSTLPPSSLMPPSSLSTASSSISIMTVAPTILSMKSPSIGQARGNHHHRHPANGPGGRSVNNSINSSSAAVTTVVGSTAGSRINSSVSSVVSYLDVIGGADFVNSLGGGDGGNLVLPAVPSSSSSSSLPSSASQLTCSSSSSSGSSSLSVAIPPRGGLDLHTSASGAANCGSNTGAMMVSGLQGTQDLPLLQPPHQGPLAGGHSLLNFNSNSQATEICVNNASALQTLASVATSSHMVGGMQPPISNTTGTTSGGGINASSHMGLGLSPNVSLGQLQQPQQSMMGLSHHHDGGSGLQQVGGLCSSL